MQFKVPKRIVILTTSPFPLGLAGTNRIISYCQGFIHNGFQPEVLCLRPTEPYANVINNKAIGIYKGIRYSYPGKTTVRVKSFWGRRKRDLLAEYATIRSLYKILNEGEVSFIIFYGNCISVELVSITISKFFKIKIFKEESENPQVYFQRGFFFLNSVKKWFVINKLYDYYSGVLVMTRPLRDFFLTKGIPDAKILIVPHTVDKGRFINKTGSYTLLLPNDYIAYLGPINQPKDGVLTLVESFKEVSAQYPEMHLVIAGIGTQQEKNELLSLINQLNLNERVHYIGRISSNEIPALFYGAKLLASCRTKSFQNDYSFPTKVVEYLTCGKPVVTTSPGDLSFYLKDKVNAFIANDSDQKTFTFKILEVLQDYDFAMEVAQNGKELVREKFSPIIQTKKIIDFCKV